MAKIENRQQLQELRAACEAAAKKETRKILVCAGTGCVSGGSLDIYAALKSKMEERGIVGPFEGSKPRQLLISKERWQELQMAGGLGADLSDPPSAGAATGSAEA